MRDTASEELEEGIRLKQSLCDPRTYGAAADGLTDDTQAVKDALYAAWRLSGIPGCLPPGVYLVRDTLIPELYPIGVQHRLEETL